MRQQARQAIAIVLVLLGAWICGGSTVAGDDDRCFDCRVASVGRDAGGRITTVGVTVPAERPGRAAWEAWLGTADGMPAKVSITRDRNDAGGDGKVTSIDTAAATAVVTLDRPGDIFPEPSTGSAIFCFY